MPKNREIISNEVVTALSNHCRTIRSHVMGEPTPSITLFISTIILSVVVAKVEQQGVRMKITVIKHNNKTIEIWYLDLNKHLTGTECTISSDVVS